MNAAFRDNVVILTGPSSGIGKELAFQLAAQGAAIALASRDAARLEEVAAECVRRGGKAIVVPTDVADPEQCRALVERTVRELGRVDTLVNNAGISMVARFDELTTLEPVDRIMRVNYMGSVYCTYHALPHLKRSKGRIVGVASLTGKTGVPTRTAYAASKHAMAGFFDSLRIELEESGVSVTMAYPGFVRSEVRERALGPDGKPLGTSHVPEGEAMSAETCARHILEAAAERRREWVMGFRAKVGLVLKAVAPGVVDGMAKKSVASGKT